MYLGFSKLASAWLKAGALAMLKLEQPQAYRRQHEVVRFDVAMDDAVLVHVRQRVGDVAREEQRVAHGDVVLALESRAQRLAFDERHGVVQRAADVARREHRRNARVVELLEHLHLEEKPLLELEPLYS